MNNRNDSERYLELRRLAVDVARDAAELIRRKRQELADAGLLEAVETKTSAVDPVTVVDKAAEEFIVSSLSSARPEDGFLGEEGEQRSGTSGITWVIDPIDGTVNFLYGFGEYSVSIAALEAGRPVAAAVINVCTGTVYHSNLGGGAVASIPGEGGVRDTALSVTAQKDLAQSLLATGFSYESRKRELQAHILTTLLPQVRDIRRVGSAALDLCRVAQGSVDAYFEHGTKPWDFAAGVLIAQEAGAYVLYPDPGVVPTQAELCLACAPGVKLELLEVLKSARALGVLG